MSKENIRNRIKHIFKTEEECRKELVDQAVKNLEENKKSKKPKKKKKRKAKKSWRGRLFYGPGLLWGGGYGYGYSGDSGAGEGGGGGDGGGG
jgi:hypothetical protein